MRTYLYNLAFFLFFYLLLFSKVIQKIGGIDLCDDPGLYENLISHSVRKTKLWSKSTCKALVPLKGGRTAAFK